MSTLLDRAPDAPTRTYPAYSRPLWQRVLLTREFAVIAPAGRGLRLLSRLNVENFDSPLTLYYLFLDMAPILLIALPMTLIIVTGEIDLSVASVVALSAACSSASCTRTPGCRSRWPARVAILAGAVAGAFNGFLVAYVGLPSLAVTIGTLALYRGLAVGLLGTKAITDFPEKWTDLATERLVPESSYPVVLVPFVLLLVVFALLLHFSTFGRGVFEIGLNSEAAHFSGVNGSSAPSSCSSCSPARSPRFAGIYYTLRYGSARGDNATGLELQVIAAVLLGGVSIFGGRGALHGVVAGVLLIGVISSAHAPGGLHGQRHQHRHRSAPRALGRSPPASSPGSQD